MGNAKLSIDEIRSIEVEILDHIDAVCKSNNIRYYLAYGTLLGAIRHKGFIPWDDDIDVFMPRSDYDRFIEIARNMDHERYKVLSLETAADYYYEYAKVVDTRTSIVASYNLLKIQDDGVWVDIFPLDKLPRCRKLNKFIINVLVAFRVLSVYKTFPRGKFSVALFPFWCVARLIGPRFFLFLTDRMSRAGKGNEFAGFMSTTDAPRYFFPRRWCDDVVEVEFEGKKYPAFKEYDSYLRFQYGDYMQLPPEEKRVSHPMIVYWRD